MDKLCNRASMPNGTQKILDRRTIKNANRNLLHLIKPGHAVLDVGCGSGAITRGICELAGKKGKVIGLDFSTHLIELAQNNYNQMSNLTFEVGDINTYQPPGDFDVISSARTLQWLPNPKEVLIIMKGFLKKGGAISVLDYNHENIQWSPGVPETMTLFYRAFLKWRSDAGFDNEIADHLESYFKEIGLVNTIVSDEMEITTSEMEDAKSNFGIWTTVAETRGKQMVEDGYVSEELRLQAIEDYNKWIVNEALSMRLYMRAITGYLPS